MLCGDYYYYFFKLICHYPSPAARRSLLPSTSLNQLDRKANTIVESISADERKANELSGRTTVEGMLCHTLLGKACLTSALYPCSNVLDEDDTAGVCEKHKHKYWKDMR